MSGLRLAVSSCSSGSSSANVTVNTGNSSTHQNSDGNSINSSAGAGVVVGVVGDGPPAASTVLIRDASGASPAYTRRRFDANKVVITIGGVQKKAAAAAVTPPPATPDWERRLRAGHEAIEHQARLAFDQQKQIAATVILPVPAPCSNGIHRAEPTVVEPDRLPPRRTSLQRSRQVGHTVSIATIDASSPADTAHRRTTSGKALQRLKPSLSTTVIEQKKQEADEAVNGSWSPPPIEKNSRRRPSHGPETDGSVLSSYQPLDVDLDDDAIMV